MTRIKQAGPPIVLVALIAGIAGYMLRGGGAQPQAVANAAQNKSGQQSKPDDVLPDAVSPVGAVPERNVYYPGSEELAPDEMRIVACGTGMPNARPKQAAACFLVELVALLSACFLVDCLFPCGCLFPR